ncbi:MAG TPA: RNA polymerase factor sigma-54 [Paludibacteraceae bacterium]|nr:RNA polymerase factor sigma-54 [Paludibacteraceae bacterium]HOL29689.1 RNA polymerase factor sigma-54 [Paludibacteraceae bacterium]HPQ12795.1 RNA polymerase factor sigma-54 [Paludibacteraceae bacterium]
MLKQQLQQKLQQKLSPAQIQVIKMLEIPTLELEERIRQELEENPVLEIGLEPEEEKKELDDFGEDYEETGNDEGESNDEIDFEEYMSDDDIPDYKLKANNTSKDDKYEEIPFSAGSTFHDFLMEQLNLVPLSERDRALAEFVIGNIDEEGYLRRTPEALADDVAFQANMDTNVKEIEKIVKIIQQFDPPGVGASSLQECLLLQLEKKRNEKEIEIPKRIIQDYFEEFSKKHYDKIINSLEIDGNTLKNAINEIIRLNPKPGNAWSGNILEKNMSIIVPDFIVENNDGELTVHLNNSNIPYLRVNAAYSEMFQDYTSNKENQTPQMKEAILFVKQKIDSARWFIDAIKQRQQTLLTTMTAIVEFQKDFFIEGDEIYLKPMILKNIADRTGYDISTISRVSNNKYVQTEFGVFPLKYFFSEAMTNDAGEEISTREIKKILQECVNNEDKRHPLNDEMLAEVLKQKGYLIARRTVAKYREQLNIPEARLRKEI